jgi:hypothetical protein
MNKMDEFKSNVDKLQPHIIGVTESWCKEEYSDAEVTLPGYSMDRKGRQERAGGGVLLYIHDSLSADPCEELNRMDAQDSLWYNIKLNQNDRLLLGVCYRSTSSDVVNNSKLLEVFERIQKLSNVYTHILIFGDFNYGEIDWKHYQVHAGENSDPQKFFDVTQDSFLYQHVPFPTRFRGDDEPSTLDLVFTNEEHMVDNIYSIAPLGKSDHVGVVWTFHCYMDPGSTRA